MNKAKTKDSKKNSRSISGLDLKSESQSNPNVLANINTGEIKYTPLNRTDFDMQITERWYEIRSKQPPKRRSHHSSFIYMDHLYVFGGQDIIEGKLGDFQRINLAEDIPKWEQIKPDGNMPGNKSHNI